MATIFVKRDQDGAIVAVSRQQLGSDWESLAEDAQELAAFTGAIDAGQNGLASTDLGLVRVLEDTIDLLISRGVIRFTDFPAAAQAKLLERRSLRASMERLDLLKEEGEDEII